MASVGFLGLGKMGRSMAPRLLDAGHALIVWNRTAGKANALVANGAVNAADPADVAAAADIVVSMLADDAAVLDVFEGSRGLLGVPVSGKLFIDMSTLRPATVYRLAERVRAQGAGFVDAPVSGTVGPARDGQLLVLCGASDDDFRHAQPILNVFARRIVHAGPVGQGALLKLVVNLPLAVYWASLGEAIAMGKHGGLNLQLMLETIQDSSAALAALSFKMPNILDPDTPVAFDVSSMQKDLQSMLETGNGAGLPMRVAEAVTATYAAAVDGGLAATDAVAVVRFLAEQMPRLESSGVQSGKEAL
jgi:3-hydroxyisobutyrate dehydrogenase-like beta-hydroxyacid dehydrogenase